MLPFVSIIIPVRNEERYIERCLYSVASQDYPRDRLEVIVVDGASSDRTPQIVSRFAAESTLDLRLLGNPRQATAPGLNAALAVARGDVIVRVDGHAAVAPDFISSSVTALEATGADCVGGPIASEGDTYMGDAIAVAMSSRFGVGGAAFRIGARLARQGPVDTVAFGAYRRHVFERIGGFAEDIDRGEDDELNYRLLDTGGSILLVPSIHASYTVRGSLSGLWHQYFAYGQAKPEVLRRHPAQARPRQLVPAAFVVALGICAQSAIFGDRRALKAAVGMYTLAATIASLATVRQHGWRPLPALPLTFACLHLSYGMGFLAGALGLVTRHLPRTARPGAHQSTEAPI